MNIEARGFRVAVVALVVCVVAIACTGGESNVTQRSLVQSPEGVPAAPFALDSTSPVTDYLRYGDGLMFAVDSPGSIEIRSNRSASVLRVRSEVRLPHTMEAAYDSGRIIERWETVSDSSRFRSVVGVGYLFVKRTPDSVFHATLYQRNYLNGDTAKRAIKQLHVASIRAAGVTVECRALNSFDSDTAAFCCLCGGTQRNCSFSEDVSVEYVLERLRRLGLAAPAVPPPVPPSIRPTVPPAM